jgi:hypothetical protein
MTVQEWTPERITVALPRSGSGSSGDVVVTVRGRKSNPRRLLAWRGKMTFTLRSQGSLTQKIDFDLHLRGDPDRARTRPGEAPKDLPDEFLLQAIRDAKGSYSASGTHTYTYTGDPCTYTEAWTGSGTMPYGPSGSGEHGLMYGGRIDAERKTLDLWAIAFGTQNIRETMGGGCNGTITVSSGFLISRELYEGGIHFPLELDASYNIRGGKREARVVGPFRQDFTSTATLEWQPIPAQPAHDPAQPKNVLPVYR